MKKLMAVLTAFVTVGCVQVLGASEDEGAKVAIIRQGEVFRVVYAAPQSSVVNLTISDEAGNKLFSEKIMGDRFVRPYNFSELPQGDYVLSVEDEKSSQSKVICHHDKAWIVQLSKLKSPEKENKFLVAIPRQPNSEMEVAVFDQHDQLVYSELAVGDQDFARIYNLKNLAGGSIQVTNKQSGEAKLLKVD